MLVKYETVVCENRRKKINTRLAYTTRMKNTTYYIVVPEKPRNTRLFQRTIIICSF